LSKTTDAKALLYFNLLRAFDSGNIDLKLVDEKIRSGDEIVKIL